MIRRKLINKYIQGLSYNKIPPISVIDIAKSLNIDIQKTKVDDKLSGFLYRDRERNQAIIGINSNQSINRNRYVIAHEIGHYLLHNADVYVDNDFNILRTNDNDIEREANLFAIGLLIPISAITIDIKIIKSLDIDDVRELTLFARKYRVSLQMMVIRLTQLGYIKL